MGWLFLLCWIIGPIGISWATFRWLQRRHPGFHARLFHSVLLGFTLNLIGSMALFFTVGNRGYWVEASWLLLPVAGAAVGYYATRRPIVS